jgi:branched-chain amino acid aminotransferase
MAQISEFIPTVILTQFGVEPTPYRVRSLVEAVSHEPQGVYTVARTFRGDHALLFEAHLDRLEQSAWLSKIPRALDRQRLRATLRGLLHEAAYPDAKFRITIPQAAPDQLYIGIEPYQPAPADILQNGAHLSTTPLVRENPVVKTTAWMIIRKPAFNSLPADTYEAVLVSEDGHLLEGLSSNFYGVLDGVLRTAGNGVLEGITRRAILDLAPAILPVRLDALHKRDLPRLTEALITSSGRGVVPVTAIDGQLVGDGHVGPIVTAITQGYNAWTDAHLEPI